MKISKFALSGIILVCVFLGVVFGRAYHLSKDVGKQTEISQRQIEVASGNIMLTLTFQDRWQKETGIGKCAGEIVKDLTKSLAIALEDGDMKDLESLTQKISQVKLEQRRRRVNRED